MTIYAIVNNMIEGGAGTTDSPAVWTIVSGASILQGGNPFFVPDFAKRFEARLALAVKIAKLGKGIAPRFAYRYAGAAAPCILFTAADKLDDLRRHGLPWTPALSYDKCIALGNFRDIEFSEIDKSLVTLRLETPDSHTESALNQESLKPDITEAIRAISVDNTLKTGDIILLGVSAEGPEIEPGQKAILSLNGEETLRFNIR